MEGKSVSIVAMGVSQVDYTTACASGFGVPPTDEVWAINAMGNVIHHDRMFMIDDIPACLGRLEAEGQNVAGIDAWLRKHPGPIYTSKVYPQYPGTVLYPLEEVVNSIGIPYLNNTVPFTVAFAIWKKVKEIVLYGCDFTYANSHVGEGGRGNTEFLLSMAIARGINVRVARNSNLMDNNVSRPFYGWKDPIIVGHEKGRYTITVADEAYMEKRRLLFRKF